MGNLTRRANCWVICASLALGSCVPSDRQPQAAKTSGASCLDAVCDGDKEPRRDPRSEVALKLNGQWFIGPKAYYSTGTNGALFYWPAKAPGYAAGEPPPEVKGKAFNEVAVEIFLTGRSRWPDPKINPLESSWQQWLAQKRQAGAVITTTRIDAHLEELHVRTPDEKADRIYYVALEERRLMGNDPPVASCEQVMRSESRCAAGEFIAPDIHADIRFNAKHAKDWPQIHHEVIRILGLLRKAES